jgi:hypothetical protein
LGFIFVFTVILACLYAQIVPVRISYNLKEVDKTRQFEDGLDVIVHAFEDDLAATVLRPLEDADEDTQSARSDILQL